MTNVPGLNKEKMLNWAEALGSGKYRQCQRSWGRGNLSDGYLVEGFCCLHVALDIEGFNRESPHKEGLLSDIYGLDYETLDLFIKMNDQQYLSFPEIAGKIRDMVVRS